MEKVTGIVPLRFSTDPGITGSRPVKVLGRLTLENGKICIDGHAVYQSVNDFLEKP
jgi:hypothetical protein